MSAFTLMLNWTVNVILTHVPDGILASSRHRVDSEAEHKAEVPVLESESFEGHGPRAGASWSGALP